MQRPDRAFIRRLKLDHEFKVEIYDCYVVDCLEMDRERIVRDTRCGRRDQRPRSSVAERQLSSVGANEIGASDADQEDASVLLRAIRKDVVAPFDVAHSRAGEKPVESFLVDIAEKCPA